MLSDFPTKLADYEGRDGGNVEGMKKPIAGANQRGHPGA